MARIRTIKPDFWTDDTITECSLSARLLFIGMWNFADDYGNLDRSAKQIKARVFPVDNINCEEFIQELITHGLLSEYSVSEKKYLHIHGFTDHQLINRPSKPICPAYDETLRTQGTLTEDSLPTHPVRKEGGKERKKIPKKENPVEEFIPPDWVPSGEWGAWLKIRKAKSNTPYALGLAVLELERLQDQGHQPIAVLRNCIMNGYQGIFPPKTDNWRNQSGYEPMPSVAGG